MEIALAWLQGLSSPLQILLIVILILVFKDDIWEFVLRRFGYASPQVKGKGENLAEKSSKEWFDEVTTLFGTLETNHISHLQEKVNAIHENQTNLFGIMRNIAEVQRDTIEILKDFKEYGVTCRNQKP